ncbi:MAG: cyclic nucleotide-binding domain-containing protein, partial [Gammaproteobacteria bacterium]|nr:cyclic nucleotide-binding domain-containing protein [Gammaproteobacteria bacterium]
LKDFPLITLKKGETLLTQGEKTDSLYFLLKGDVLIIRDDIEIASSSEKGSVYGEMSLMLGNAHSATVKCLKDSQFYQIENPLNFLTSHPEVILHIAQILSQRLYNVNSYLIDIKHQFDNEVQMKIVDDTLRILQGQDSSLT